MKTHLLTFTCFALFTGSLIAEESPSRYVIQEGVMSGLPNPPAVTILLDTYTGRSWMLGVVDGTPKWLPLSFNEKEPQNIIPTPIEIPNGTKEK
jgi:hypothetical protein